MLLAALTVLTPGGLAFRHIHSAKLSERLSLLSKLVCNFPVVADIGCDHGLLSESLADGCKTIYAIDNNYKIIQDLDEKIKHRGLNNVLPICGDGIQPLFELNQNIDAVVFSGMGANLISSILSRNCFKTENGLYGLRRLGVKRLVIQPSPSTLWQIEGVHTLLSQNNWKCIEQFILQENNIFHLFSSFAPNDNPQILSSGAEISDGQHRTLYNNVWFRSQKQFQFWTRFLLWQIEILQIKRNNLENYCNSIELITSSKNRSLETNFMTVKRREELLKCNNLLKEAQYCLEDLMLYAKNFILVKKV